MASKLFETIREIVHSSDFESYCEEIQVTGVSGVPTTEESKKDFQALLWARTSVMIS